MTMGILDLEDTYMRDEFPIDPVKGTLYVWCSPGKQVRLVGRYISPLSSFEIKIFDCVEEISLRMGRPRHFRRRMSSLVETEVLLGLTLTHAVGCNFNH